MISAEFSEPPTVSELLIAYPEMVSRNPEPDIDEFRTLSRSLERATERLAPAIRTMRVGAWSREGPGAHLSVDGSWLGSIRQPDVCVTA